MVHPRLHLLAIAAVAVVVGSPAAAVARAPDPPPPGRHQADRLVVMFHPGASSATRTATHALARVRRTDRVGDGRSDVVTLPPGTDLERAAGSYRHSKAVLSVERSWLYRTSAVTNDPGMSHLWGLHNVGQEVANTGQSGLADVDIDAPEGWAAAYGTGRYPSSGGALVGVIDTGVDATHPDLAGKVVACASAISGTGAVLDGVCADDNGHGTHVAGTVAARANNSIGIAGVAPDATLAVFKAMDATGQGSDVDIAAGIRWLRTQGVDVINMSFGDPQSSSLLSRELTAATAAGIVLVAAAGNEGDATVNFPAAHRDVISVSAVDAWGTRAGFSNCNSDVEVAGPGVAIVSTVPGGGYARFDGTSMAAPHVSGVAALLRSAAGLSAPATRLAISSRAQGSGGCNGVGLVNLAAALGPVATTSPSPDPAPAPLPSAPAPSAPPAVSPEPVGSPEPAVTPGPAGPPALTVPPASTSTQGGGRYIPLSPARIVDTRIGLGTAGMPFARGESRELAIAGLGGLPAEGVAAVVVNLTATGSTTTTYLTAYPAASSRPSTSSLNLSAGRSAAALVTAGLTAGRLAVYNHSGSVDVVLDVVGYFTDTSRPDGAGYAAVDPSRILDTRDGSGAFSGGETRVVQVSGRAGVPESGASAVVVNLTVVAPTRSSFVAGFAADAQRPSTSNVNVAAGETRANLAVVQLDPAGRLALFNNAGSSHLVVDVLGWYGEAAAGRFVSVTPRRVLDTRVDGGAVSSGVSVSVDVGAPAGAIAAVVTVTATGPSAAGFLAAHPAGRVATTSTVNFLAGATVANLSVVPLGDDGRIAVRNGPGRTHALVDVVGYITAS